MTFRGAALRDLRSLLEKKLPKFAGLNRIGDDDGTAVWTLLTDPEEVKAAIEERAAQRRAEARRRDERFQELMDNADAGSHAGETGAAAATHALARARDGLVPGRRRVVRARGQARGLPPGVREDPGSVDVLRGPSQSGHAAAEDEGEGVQHHHLRASEFVARRSDGRAEREGPRWGSDRLGRSTRSLGA